MSLWLCTACSARYAVGLEACPQCGDTGHLAEPLPPTAWTCQNSDCRAQYRLKLLECPRCRGTHMRLEEIMPHITVHGGPNIPRGDAPVPAEVPAASALAETAAAETETPAPADASARPSVNAPKAAWVDHVAASGLDREQAEAMTKEALRAWTPTGEAAPDVATEMTITADAEVTRPEARP